MDFLKRLTSRKFLLVVFALVALLGGVVPDDQKWTLIFLVATYLTAEGIGDAADRVATQKTKQVELTLAQQKQQQDINLAGDDDDDVDYSQVVSGDAPL